MPTQSFDLDLYLRPRSIAIIGFSARPGSPSHACLGGLTVNNFAGEIHLVGRTAGEIDGRPILGSVDELPEGIDLALLLVPAVAVRDAVAGIIRRGVKAGVIFASGFAELGEASRREQEAIAQMAQAAGLPLVGPNCMGYTNYAQPLHIGFMPAVALKPLAAGTTPGVALVTQSGGLMAHFYQALDAKRVPIAYRISTGNEVGVQIGDFIDHLADDPVLRVISCYAEHIRSPQRFLAAVRRARAAGKTVVLLHPGRTERAQRAAASHTGALASNHDVMAACVTEAGVLLVDSLEEMIDVTELLVRFPVPPQQGVAVLTTSGALCAHANDCCEALGLDVPAFTPSVMDALRKRMPDFVELGNPFDLTTQVVWDMDLTADCVKLALSDPKIGSVNIIVPVGNPKGAMHTLERVIALQAGQPKPLILSIMGEDLPLEPAYIQAVRESGLLFTRSGERALRTLAKVTAYGRRLASADGPGADAPAASGTRLSAGSWAEWEGKALLRDAGITTPRGALVQTADACVAAAAEMGYPVALKLQSRQLLHKTEIGGVVLGLRDEAALRTAWATLAERAAAASDAKLDGMLVEKMSAPGLEMIVGARRDPAWGPMLVVGLGGVWVEALKDVRLLPATASAARIAAELRSLKTAALLGPFRGAAARDVTAVAQVASAIGQVMIAHPEIDEIDLNPLMVMAEGEGAVALDALVIVSAADA